MITAVLPLETQEQPHERKGGVWSYVSASRLNLWLRCPLAFRLRYIDGIRSPGTPSLFVGKIVHTQLEQFYRHRQLGINLDASDLECRLGAKWNAAVEEENMKFDTVQKENDLKAKASGLVSAYIDQVPEDESSPIAIEATMESIPND